MPKSLYDSEFGGCISCSNDCYADRRELFPKRKALLKARELFEKNCIRPFWHWYVLLEILICMKSGKTLCLVNNLAAVIKEHGVSIKCNAHLIFWRRFFVLRRGLNDRSRTSSPIYDALGILYVCCKK